MKNKAKTNPVQQTYTVPKSGLYEVWTYESDSKTMVLTDEQVCRLGFEPYRLPQWKDANAHQKKLILILSKII